MIDLTSPEYQRLSQDWFREVAGALRGPWRLLDAQYRLGIDLLGVFSQDAGAAGGPGARPETSADLERRALERVRKGLSPPREVYEAQHRARIDWSRFPEWARPIDPEVFTGSPHEG